MEHRAGRNGLALALLLLCVVQQGLVRAMIALVLPEGYASVAARETVLWLIPALLLLPWRTRRLGAKEDLRWMTLLALPMGVLLQMGVMGVRAMLPLTGATIQAPGSAAEWALAVMALAILPAVCEEAFFRGGVLAYLRDVMSPVKAFLLTSLLFALAHGSVSGFLPQLLVGMGCTLLMMNTGRVHAAMLLHLGYNLTALAGPYLPTSPWMGLLGVVPVGAMLLTAYRMRWKSSGKHASKMDIALIAASILWMTARLWL